MLGLGRVEAKLDTIPEPTMHRLGILGLPRGRIISVSGPDPEKRQARLWRWALHFFEQGARILWLDPLATCQDGSSERPSPFPVLSPRSFEAVDQLFKLTLPASHTDIIILDDFHTLQAEDQVHRSETRPPPMKWRRDTRHLSRWTGLCWRHQCTLVVGRRGLGTTRDPVDNHSVLRLEINPTRGSLQLLESRTLVPGPGWRRQPGG